MRRWTSSLGVLLVAALASAGDRCTQETACRCVFPDGTQIDLSGAFGSQPVNGSVYLSASKDNFTIFYHGCVDVTFQLRFKKITNELCRHPATMCVFDAGTRALATLASASTATFTTGDNLAPLMTYRMNVNANNQTTTTTVELVCTRDFDVDVLHLVSVTGNGTEYKVRFFSSHACRTTAPHGLSTGTKLLMMFFAFGCGYLAGGALLAYFVRGARGRELIPNIDFWMRLPGLVKDGAVFLLSGCNTRFMTTAETYDQI